MKKSPGQGNVGSALGVGIRLVHPQVADWSSSKIFSKRKFLCNFRVSRGYFNVSYILVTSMRVQQFVYNFSIHSRGLRRTNCEDSIDRLIEIILAYNVPVRIRCRRKKDTL